MPYAKISEKQVEEITNKRKQKKDAYGIDWYLAVEIAQKIFGSKGYAAYKYSFTMNDPVGPDSYVIPMGSLIGYEIGYARKGKRGATLHTKWQGNSYAEAFVELLNDYGIKDVKTYDKVLTTLVKYEVL